MADDDELDDLPGVILAGPPPPMIRIEKAELEDLEARAQAAEADADRQGKLLKDALFYLRWQLDDHDKGYDEHGCRCDWSKTVRDFFGFDDPDNALAQHKEAVRARGEG